MASSSTSSVHKSFKYDVFLSFRGEDTRNTFVGHLYNALQHNSIHTYKDDERIKKGERISDELTKSIEDSKFYIIVFSRNYASSSWCLDELVKIIECQKTTEHTAYPVFYDVEPTEVRKQSGEFGNAFAKQEKKEAAEKWREAMEEAAGLAGWELKKTVNGDEAKFIQKIVEEISLELRCINVNVDEKLVGMETRIKDVVSSLDMGFDDVRMIGIKGMGGAGKTTLARAVFDQISYEFEGSSFVENVRENSNPNLSGLKKLQKQVLKDVLNDLAIKISNVHEGKKMMKRRMCCIKVLVVLDDVDNIHQLEALAGERNWFKTGSRIIITTRDEQPMVAHRINSILYANLLSNREALCLFSRYAFGKEIPIQGYEKLSYEVVLYAAGLPLALTVLGSFLCGKNEPEWENAIQRLATVPSMKTFDVLEISYNGLEEDHKEIFLDVACIFKGFDKNDAIKALESCGFYATIGLRVLEQKSLITIDRFGCLDMHDRIEEMGQYIIRREHEEPSKRSRLWIKEEIEDVLRRDQGPNEAIRCIKLIDSELNLEIVTKGLGNMKKLRFLQVDNGGMVYYNNNWKFDEVCKYFPNALRSLRWECYPFGSLPKSFQANNLVELYMPRSNIVQLWEGEDTKVLNKLRFLDLNYSKLKTLDLRGTPNLEELTFNRCVDLVELHIPDECLKLKSISISCCSKLTTLDLRGTPNLEKLDLEYCYALVALHISGECLKLKSININYSKLTTLNLRGTPNLEELTLNECFDLVELHIPGECLELKSIIILDTMLTTLDLQGTPNLEKLDLEYCYALVALHISGECLKLKSININYSKLTTLDLRGTLNLEKLFINCYDMVELHIPGEYLELKSIIILDTKLTTLDLRGTPNLEKLGLEHCDALVALHISSECLKLKSIDINDSKLTTLDLRGTLNLEKLFLSECYDMVELHIPGECLKLKSIIIRDTKLTTLDLRGTPNLEHLTLNNCYYLVEVHAHDGCLKKLYYIKVSGCLRFKSFLFKKHIESVKVGCGLHLKAESPLQFECFNEEHGSSLMGNVEKLISFALCACTNLDHFSQSIYSLQGLTNLTLEGSIQEAPKDLDQLECLEELHLLSTKITRLPDNICNLKHLKCLKLDRCLLLETLPEDLGRLECLEKLILSECVFLQHIPNSICMMKRLQYFLLPSCIAVEKLPEGIGRLRCLKELNIEGTNIRHLPESIFELNVEGTSIRESLFELKGLRIVGYRWLLQSYGFTNQIQTSEERTFCYVEL